MNINFSFVIVCFLSFAACNPQTPTDHVLHVEGCYRSGNEKDSIRMELSANGTHIKGHLLYWLYQKDKNEGTLEGKMYNDTLIADYTFNSEGTKSIREMAFLLKDTSLIEGYGEMTFTGEKLIFKNRKKLSFPGSVQLNKINCKK